MAPRGKSLLDSLGVKLTPPAAFFESPAHSSLAAIQQSQPHVAKQPLPFLSQAHHENSSNEAVRATGGQRGFLFDRIPAPMVDLEEDSTSLYVGHPQHSWKHSTQPLEDEEGQPSGTTADSLYSKLQEMEVRAQHEQTQLSMASATRVRGEMTRTRSHLSSLQDYRQASVVAREKHVDHDTGRVNMPKAVPSPAALELLNENANSRTDTTQSSLREAAAKAAMRTNFFLAQSSNAKAKTRERTDEACTLRDALPLSLPLSQPLSLSTTLCEHDDSKVASTTLETGHLSSSLRLSPRPPQTPTKDARVPLVPWKDSTLLANGRVQWKDSLPARQPSLLAQEELKDEVYKRETIYAATQRAAVTSTRTTVDARYSQLVNSFRQAERDAQELGQIGAVCGGGWREMGPDSRAKRLASRVSSPDRTDMALARSTLTLLRNGDGADGEEAFYGERGVADDGARDKTHVATRGLALAALRGESKLHPKKQLQTLVALRAGTRARQARRAAEAEQSREACGVGKGKEHDHYCQQHGKEEDTATLSRPLRAWGSVKGQLVWAVAQAALRRRGQEELANLGIESDEIDGAHCGSLHDAVDHIVNEDLSRGGLGGRRSVLLYDDLKLWAQGVLVNISDLDVEHMWREALQMEAACPFPTHSSIRDQSNDKAVSRLGVSEITALVGALVRQEWGTWGELELSLAEAWGVAKVAVVLWHSQLPFYSKRSRLRFLAELLRSRCETGSDGDVPTKGGCKIMTRRRREMKGCEMKSCRDMTTDAYSTNDARDYPAAAATSHDCFQVDQEEIDTDWLQERGVEFHPGEGEELQQTGACVSATIDGTSAYSAEQEHVYASVMQLAAAHDWRAVSSMEADARAVADALQSSLPAVAMIIYGTLGNCHYEQGCMEENTSKQQAAYCKAAVLLEHAKAIAPTPAVAARVQAALNHVRSASSKAASSGGRERGAVGEATELEDPVEAQAVVSLEGGLERDGSGVGRREQVFGKNPMLPTRLAADQRGMRPLYVPSQHSQYMVHRNKVPQPPKSPPRNCTLARSGFVQAGDKAVRVAVWNHSVDEFGVLTGRVLTTAGGTRLIATPPALPDSGGGGSGEAVAPGGGLVDTPGTVSRGQRTWRDRETERQGLRAERKETTSPPAATAVLSDYAVVSPAVHSVSAARIPRSARSLSLAAAQIPHARASLLILVLPGEQGQRDQGAGDGAEARLGKVGGWRYDMLEPLPHKSSAALDDDGPLDVHSSDVVGDGSVEKIDGARVRQALVMIISGDEAEASNAGGRWWQEGKGGDGMRGEGVFVQSSLLNRHSARSLRRQAHSTAAALSVNDLQALQRVVSSRYPVPKDGGEADKGLPVEAWLRVFEDLIDRVPKTRGVAANSARVQPKSALPQETRCDLLARKGIGSGDEPGALQSKFGSAMVSALADSDLPLHKVWANPRRALHVKELRHRVSFQWANATIISAFKSWVQATRTEKARVRARESAEAAAVQGLWKSRFLQGPHTNSSVAEYSSRMSGKILTALTASSAPALAALSSTDYGALLADKT